MTFPPCQSDSELVRQAREFFDVVWGHIFRVIIDEKGRELTNRISMTETNFDVIKSGTAYAIKYGSALHLNRTFIQPLVNESKVHKKDSCDVAPIFNIS